MVLLSVYHLETFHLVTMVGSRLLVPAAVLTNGTVVVGKNMMTGSTTDGSGDVMADDSSAEFLIGGVINVGATTEYSLVDLQIRA